MTVHFHKDFDFRVSDNETFAYLAGTTADVTQDCARLAVLARAGEVINEGEDE